jgi:hypothetical protein
MYLCPFFLQQYWGHPTQQYRFVPVSEFVHAYQKTDTARRMQDVLDMPYDKAASPEGALVNLVALLLSALHCARVCYAHC